MKDNDEITHAGAAVTPPLGGRGVSRGVDRVDLLLHQAASAVHIAASLQGEDVKNILCQVAARLVEKEDVILAGNEKDLAKMDVSDPKYDRLRLTSERIRAIADDMKNVAELPSPHGSELEHVVRPNGMVISKVSVPFGVVGVIYEARPNVTADVFSLCLKSGNVAVLKGGSDAEASNQAIVGIIHEVLESMELSKALCTLLSTDREATTMLLEAEGVVDLIIPRGGKTLINYVRRHALVPVIETGAGVCHTYFDRSGNLEKGRAIVANAKTRRVSVCNALDCLIIHRDRLQNLPALCMGDLQEKNVEIYADDSAFEVLSGHYPPLFLKHATEEHFGTEFLDYKMSIKTVDSIEEALVHIAHYGSKHSECIVAEDAEAIALFQQRVDAACVYTNVSTAFTDGAQFGFGAEIGISTQKLHARGPMGLRELNTYKYVITGDGQIRCP